MFKSSTLLLTAEFIYILQSSISQTCLISLLKSAVRRRQASSWLHKRKSFYTKQVSMLWTPNCWGCGFRCIICILAYVESLIKLCQFIFSSHNYSFIALRFYNSFIKEQLGLKILNLNSNSIMFVILTKLHKFSMFLNLENKDHNNGCIVELLGRDSDENFINSLVLHEHVLIPLWHFQS